VVVAPPTVAGNLAVLCIVGALVGGVIVQRDADQRSHIGHDLGDRLPLRIVHPCHISLISLSEPALQRLVMGLDGHFTTIYPRNAHPMKTDGEGLLPNLLEI